MNRRNRLLVGCLVAGFLYLAVNPMMAGSGTETAFFFCKSKVSPCVSLDKKGCTCTDGDLRELKATRKNIMGTLKFVTKSFRAYAKKGNQEKLREISGSIAVLGGLLADRVPEKKMDKKAEFQSLAGELSSRAANVASRAAAGPGDAFIAYKRYEDMCAICHKSFR